MDPLLAGRSSQSVVEANPAPDSARLLSDGPHPPDVRVSVVVPTHHRPDLLRRCVSALLVQTMDPRHYEIVIVDDGASPDTERIVAEIGRCSPFPAVRYLASADRRGPAAARNLGWQAASAPIVAFTDDDCIPAPDWLAQGVSALTDTSLSGVWGRIVVPLPLDPTDYALNTKGLERAPCATANCFYRKGALDSVGGFDERFTAAWREDSDLEFMLHEGGHRLAPCQEAVVVHPVRPAPWGVSLQQQRNNRFNALLYKKHPALYRTRLQAAPPWRYYAAMLALVGAVGFGVGLRHVPAALACGILWAGLTVDFCARRLHRTSRRPSHVLEMVLTSMLIPPLAVFWRLYGAYRYRVWFL